MSSILQSSDDAFRSSGAVVEDKLMLDDQNSDLSNSSSSDLLLRRRIKMVEDLWESVLREECGQELVDLLQELRSLCSPEGQAASTPEANALQLVEQLDLNEAIRAARAFALYFQLINIVEQHYEQRGQQQQYREDSERLTAVYAAMEEEPTSANSENPSRGAQAEILQKTLQDSMMVRRESRTLQGLFPKLRSLNVPPRLIQRLVDKLDIRLVFTAHPTEIVRHTIRDKQRRIGHIMRQLDQIQDASASHVAYTSWEADELRNQLTEELRLWWRTDELHQFKPTVLDEVDYTLHYFNEVLFDIVPHLYHRFERALHSTFPRLRPPRPDFCKFGSWVGSDRDGNPSVTPEVTWKTACYQRSLVLQKYIQSVKNLTQLLSMSLHWSDVLPELLESLEQDQMHFPAVYEQLAIRYRQEPYRLKLAYIQQRLENTYDRNMQLYNGDGFKDDIPVNSNTMYTSGEDFLAELRLIHRSLKETGLSCQALDNLICQAEIYGFNLAHLDIRQESSRHSDTVNEIVEYLGILDCPYDEMSEEARTAWLVQELKTRRPLIPSELPFSDKTSETIQTFRMVRRLHQEFGVPICNTYVVSMSHHVSDLLEVL
ncbi:MAG: phosphoenolpyruvate carboxylase, partial [Synechococcales cyanobacterium T60_A2020_003]|nr:phosphoenolpyruvate carboxylase [Synechococcales cyanobacterium T60_A2020_003]